MKRARSRPARARLCGARPEFLEQVAELALGDLAVVGHLEQVPAHITKNLHGTPEILARLTLRRIGSGPGLDVISLQRLEGFRQELVAQQRIGLRALGDRALQSV